MAFLDMGPTPLNGLRMGTTIIDEPWTHPNIEELLRHPVYTQLENLRVICLDGLRGSLHHYWHGISSVYAHEFESLCRIYGGTSEETLVWLKSALSVEDLHIEDIRGTYGVIRRRVRMTVRRDP